MKDESPFLLTCSFIFHIVNRVCDSYAAMEAYEWEKREKMLSLQQILTRDLLCGKAIDDPAEEMVALKAIEQKPTMSLFHQMVRPYDKATHVAFEVNVLASCPDVEKVKKEYARKHGVALETVGTSFAIPLYSHGISVLGSDDKAKINRIFANQSKFRKLIRNYVDAPAGYNMLLRYVRAESEIKYETLRDVHVAMKQIKEYDCVTVAKDEHAGYYCHPHAIEEDCQIYKQARIKEIENALQPLTEENRKELLGEFIHSSPEKEVEQRKLSFEDSRKAPYVFKGIYLG